MSEMPVVSNEDTERDNGPALSLTVYSPQSPLRNPVLLIRSIFSDLWRTRELIRILFFRDMKAQFRQSVLGYGWLILPPIVSAAGWYVMNRSGMMRIETGDVAPSQFIIVGTTLWAAFSATLTTPIDAIEANKSVFTKLNVPIEAFIFAAIGRLIFNLAISSGVLILLLLMLGSRFGLTALLFPMAAFSVLTMGVTIGMLLAPASTLYTDIRRALAAFIGLLMFTVPVIFRVPDEGTGLVALVVRNNPLTPAFALARDSLLTGSLEWLVPSLLWLAACGPLILASLVILRVARPHIVTRMGM